MRLWLPLLVKLPIYKMKKVLKRQLTNLEPRPTSKKYIKRVYEQQEAEQEIKEYENRTNVSGTTRLDGLGPIGSERSQGKL